MNQMCDKYCIFLFTLLLSDVDANIFFRLSAIFPKLVMSAERPERSSSLGKYGQVSSFSELELELFLDYAGIISAIDDTDRWG